MIDLLRDNVDGLVALLAAQCALLVFASVIFLAVMYGWWR